VRLLLLAILIFTGLQVSGQPDYKPWDQLLSKYVNVSGNVDYAGLKKDEATLDKIVDQFSKTKIDKSWSKNDQLAFWINAYNAFTLQLITDNFPIKSIQNLDGGKTWDVKRFIIDGSKYSLNQIENDIIRSKFNDARIHFAVNCGAKSCPPLLNGAFFGNKLDQQLEDQAKKFINNQSYNKISSTSLSISKIFDWYKADFGILISFLNKLSKVKINPNTKISFKEYDWSLNGR
jgi:hypothetical protein